MTPTRRSAIWSGCCGSARTDTALPRRAVRHFADRLNGVINRTVSDSRLSLIQMPGTRAFQLARLVDGEQAPLELHGSTVRLFVHQVIVVEDGRCGTEAYGYRLQAGESEPSWLIRWEYTREAPKPDYPYPLAHVHVNGAFASRDAVLPKLHVPTRPVPLELVLWHLIVEWGVKPKRDDWRRILEDSMDGFEPGRAL